MFLILTLNGQLWAVNCVPTMGRELYPNIPRCRVTAGHSLVVGLPHRPRRHEAPAIDSLGLLDLRRLGARTGFYDR